MNHPQQNATDNIQDARTSCLHAHPEYYRWDSAVQISYQTLPLGLNMDKN